MTPQEALRWAIEVADNRELNNTANALRVAAAAVERDAADRDAADRGPRQTADLQALQQPAGVNLRRIADEHLERGSRDWAEAHRISGYIEGLEEGRDLLKRLATPWGPADLVNADEQTKTWPAKSGPAHGPVRSRTPGFVSSLTDAELLQRSAETGAPEMGEMVNAAWREGAGWPPGNWLVMPETERNAWRRAAQVIWNAAK